MSSLNPFSPIQTTTPLTGTPASDNEINERQIFLKFALIGDAKTGKTSIVNRFTENRFNADYHPTISPSSYNAQQIVINDHQTNNKYIIQLQLWDTNGELPLNTDKTSTPSPLKLQKHPQSNSNHKKHTKPQRTECLSKTIRQTKHIDLQSFFTEFDAKEAMEDKQHKQTPNDSNTTHIDYKSIVIHDRNGYSCGSQTETISKSSQIMDILTSNPSANTQHFNRLIFEGVDALILVYDITQYDSLTNLNEWIELFAKYTMSNEEIPILVLGNKTDKEQKRCITYKDGRKFCQSLMNPHRIFKEVSAKTGDDIKDIFTELARICIKKDYHILQLISSDSISSTESINAYKPTYKRRERSNGFSVKTCAHNFCSNQGEDVPDPPFCVVL